MKVLVDTSLWSLALRRRKGEDSLSRLEQQLVKNFKTLIQDGRVSLIGPVRQEILSGIASDSQFIKMRDYLSAFEDLPLDSHDYERAAEFFNTCRKKGVQGSHGDFIICAAAERYNLLILTTDRDFLLYEHHLGVKLLK